MGQTDITASKDGFTSIAVVLNVIVELKSIVVAPVNATIVLGLGGQTVQYTATGTFTDDSTRAITNEVAWNSSDTGAATISGAGLATAQAVGQTDITASKDGVTSNTAILNVVHPVAPGVQVVINEIVVDPQRDWDDSSGGAAVGDPFDDTPGDAVAPDAQVNSADQWIELTNVGTVTANLFNWALFFKDALGNDVIVVFDDITLTLAPGEYLVIANPGNIGLSSTITLIDALLATRDIVNLEVVHDALGNATGVDDEAITRVPDGNDTNNVADFQRKAATIGTANPAE